MKGTLFSKTYLTTGKWPVQYIGDLSLQVSCCTSVLSLRLKTRWIQLSSVNMPFPSLASDNDNTFLYKEYQVPLCLGAHVKLKVSSDSSHSQHLTITSSRLHLLGVSTLETGSLSYHTKNYSTSY